MAAARLFGAAFSYGMHGALYYAVFLAFTGRALLRTADGPEDSFWAFPAAPMRD